jgi:multiple antibiotic resistance protein
MEFLVSAVVTLFIVIDPIALAPLFITLTASDSEPRRRAIARKAVLVAAGIMAIFAILGKPILVAMGISLDAFYIAGGALLFLIAIDMVLARPSRTRETPEEEAEGVAAADVSVFPLAIPIMSGPGSMATIVLLVTGSNGNVAKLGSIALGLVIALSAAYLVMRMSGPVMRALRQTGIAVTGRVMGVILAALAVQYIVNGIQNLVR